HWPSPSAVRVTVAPLGWRLVFRPVVPVVLVPADCLGCCLGVLVLLGVVVVAGLAGSAARERGVLALLVGAPDPALADAVVLPARFRAGRTVVTSAAENDRTSFDPAGRTWMKSPSSGSARAMTLPERPSGTPTAAAVNHTVGVVPAASSSLRPLSSSGDSGGICSPGWWAAPSSRWARSTTTIPLYRTVVRMLNGVSPRPPRSRPGRPCGCGTSTWRSDRARWCG